MSDTIRVLTYAPDEVIKQFPVEERQTIQCPHCVNVLTLGIDTPTEISTEERRFLVNQASQGWDAARHSANERDERFEQLKLSEAEADHYRLALRLIADGATHAPSIARLALNQP